MRKVSYICGRNSSGLVRMCSQQLMAVPFLCRPLAQRGKGVGILLNSVVTDAWKQAGEVWKAVNSVSKLC